jgi:hypothetical protein
MPKFHFRNIHSGKIETAGTRECRNKHEAAEVCAAWCRITSRIAENFEPVFVPTPTVGEVFDADRKAGFAAKA